MAGPPPAVAATRSAVRRWLEQWLPEAAGSAPQPGPLVLVGCSGGADSLALAAASAFVAPRMGLRAGVVVVDHGLQQDSHEVAHQAARQCRELLAAAQHRRSRGAPDADAVPDPPVQVVPVTVPVDGSGPEGAARQARYAALAAAADRHGAAAVLLGHTRDDQAETVLLGLARGAGGRSICGMAPARPLVGDVLVGRPLLELGREQTRQACNDLGLRVWDDPHNEDRRFARVRARQALADLELSLGPGLAGNLARTADLLRADAEALDGVAHAAYRQLGEPPWLVSAVAAHPPAVRTRLWRRLALEAGSPGTDLSSEHLLAVDELVCRWRGQGPLHLPGGVRAGRSADRVWLVRQA